MDSRNYRIIDVTGDDSSDEEKVIDVSDDESNYASTDESDDESNYASSDESETLEIVDVSDDESFNNTPQPTSFYAKNPDHLYQLAQQVQHQLNRLNISPRRENPFNQFNFFQNSFNDRLDIDRDQERREELRRREERHREREEEKRREERRKEREEEKRREERRKEREEEKRREEKRKEREARERLRFINAVSNKNVFDGADTLGRDTKYKISTRVAQYNGKTYPLLQGNVDIVQVMQANQTIIYLDKASEPTIIDPNNPRLNRLYNEFVEENERKIARYKKDYSDEYLIAILKKLGDHISEACGVDDTKPAEKEKIQEKMLDNTKYQHIVYVGDSNKKLIGLELGAVMKKKAADCRYNAMYTCYMIGRLVSEGKLPLGEVYSVGEIVKERWGHGLACYRTGDHFFLVDPYYGDTPILLDLNVKAERHEARKRFGEKCINRIIKRYRDAEFEPQSRMGMPR